MRHAFAFASDDDHYCTECGVTVADEALPLYTAECPAPECEAPSNPGPCVIVLVPAGVDGAAACAYCT